MNEKKKKVSKNKIDSLNNIPKIKRLYMDLETSPNIVTSWNVGYKLNIDYSNIIKERAIICICWKWEGEDTVHSLAWDNGDDHKLVKEFYDVMLEADEVVGHNGDRFDIKWFKTRCLYHGITKMPDIKSIDTLKIARKEFKFNSNRLDYIAKFLGFEGKIKTTFDLWKQVMANDKQALKDMITYCKGDVVVLEKVYNKLEGYTKAKTHVGVLNGHSKCSCPKCGSNNTVLRKTRVSAAGTISKQLQCKDCKSYFTISKTEYDKSINPE